jgi:hypothetical protein
VRHAFTVGGDARVAHADPAVRHAERREDLLAHEDIERLARVPGTAVHAARASLLAERYVRDHGVADNATAVDDDVPTFLHALKAAGYHTAVVGETHLWVHERGRVKAASEHAGVLRRFGFDDVIETAGKVANLYVDSEYTAHLRGRADAPCAARRAPRCEMRPHGRGGSARRRRQHVQPARPCVQRNPSRGDRRDRCAARRACVAVDHGDEAATAVPAAPLPPGRTRRRATP